MANSEQRNLESRLQSIEAELQRCKRNISGLTQKNVGTAKRLAIEASAGQVLISDGDEWAPGDLQGFTFEVVRTSSDVSPGVVGTAYFMDGTGGAIALTLPDSSANEGAIIYVERTNSSGSNVSLRPAGSDTINYSTGTITFTAQGDSRLLVSNGNGGWFVMAS